MIYFGVHLFDRAFRIVALSDTFIPLGYKSFSIKNHSKFCYWMRACMNMWDEPNKWFFDQTEFNRLSFVASFFLKLGYCHEIFLVNHRKLIENASFIRDWSKFCHPEINLRHTKYANAMILASALRLFEPQYIENLIDEDDLPF